MATRDSKQFYFGSLIGVLVSYIPYIFKSPVDGGLTTMINYLPNKLAELLKLTPDSGIGSFVMVGTPTLWTLLIFGIAGGLVLMFTKR